MIGAAANSYMHVVGSQWLSERNAELECADVSGEERYVTTPIMAAKETRNIGPTIFFSSYHLDFL